MRRIAVLLTLVASTMLLVVSAYTIATAAPPMGDMVAQNTTTPHVRRLITREGRAPPSRPAPFRSDRAAERPHRHARRFALPPTLAGLCLGSWILDLGAEANGVGLRALERPPERMGYLDTRAVLRRGSDWVCRSGHWE